MRHDRPEATAASEPQEALLQIARGYRAAQALAVVAKLGVADELASGPRRADELAAAVGAHAPSLYRLLRAVASLGVFAENADGRFWMTPLAEPLRTDVPGSVRAFVSFYGEPFFWEPWGHLLHSVRTGETALDHLYGMGLFAYLDQHPDAAQAFNAGLAVAPDHAAVVAVYDFAPVRSLVDVGGGHGALLAAILRAHPALHGVLFDQPAVAADARAHLEAAGVAERCQIVAGDFFAAVPGGGDAYLLSTIIHDWDDGRAVAILQNCRRAMPEQGRLLLVEQVVPAGNDPSPSKFADLNMLVVTGGRERTAAEYRALCAAAGFRVTGILPTRDTASVIEAVVA